MAIGPTGSRFKAVSGGNIRVGIPVAASLTTALTGTNNDLVFTADTKGKAGNDIRVRYVVAGNNTALSIVVATNDITVNVATDAGGLATSTAADVKTALDGDTAAAALINTANAASNDGTGVVAAFAFTNLAGGVSYAFGTYRTGLASRKARA